MKTILLPTDLTLSGKNAEIFAIELAQRSNAQIIVVHACPIPTFDNNIPPSIIDHMEQEKLNIEKELKLL